MSRHFNWKSGLLTVLITTLITGVIYQIWPQKPNPISTLSCINPLQGCQIELERQPVHIQFIEPPSGLHPFTLRVTTPKASRISATFSMRDMDMGSNRYILVRNAPETWQAKVVLPVCVSGRHDWLLTLDIDGNHILMPFTI